MKRAREEGGNDADEADIVPLRDDMLPELRFQMWTELRGQDRVHVAMACHWLRDELYAHSLQLPDSWRIDMAGLTQVNAARLSESWGKGVRTAKALHLDKLKHATSRIITVGITMRALLVVSRDVDATKWQIFVKGVRVDAMKSEDKKFEEIVPPEMAIRVMRQ
jgi:hypothetical protein